MSEEQCSGDDIVISGISGRFPNSNNVREFGHNLFNQVDMIDDDETRWKHFNPEVPKRSGKIRNLEKFDASFFSMLNKHSHQMDPQSRILLEHSYEAILDAGISPESLVKSRTGVFISCSFADSIETFMTRIPAKEGWGIIGSANFYLSNRISYALGICGPSFTVDTDNSGSGYALDCAYKYIMSGACDAALVGGSQLIMNMATSVEYSRLGMLATDGISRPFDKDANGFVRADTISVVFLQRQKDSKRVYAKLVRTNSNLNGFKMPGSNMPPRVMQQKLMEELFKDSKIDPSLVDFVETNCYGDQHLDAEEVAAIDEVYCKNVKRSKPLMIGSVKSNMGNAESSAGIAAIAKLVLTLENRKIPPNLNFTATMIPAITEGRVTVPTEVKELVGEYVSMNTFGIAGANVSALFKGNSKEKINSGLPKDDLSRLLLWSARTIEAIKSVFDEVVQRPLDAEFLALLQSSQVQTNAGNVYRGYGMFSQDNVSGKAVLNYNDVHLFTSERRPIVWVFAGVGSQWLGMGTDLMRIPVFTRTVEKCHDVLLPHGIDVMKIVTSHDEKMFDNVMNTYIGVAAVEIGLTEVLRALGLEPDYIIGHSSGEIGVAYADDCFTLEEAMLTSMSRGIASRESQTILGAMAAVGMNHKEVGKILPGDIDIACHNSPDSTTISGPVESVKAFVKTLTAKNIFAREVPCSGTPLHSRYIKEMGAKLVSKLRNVIKKPRKRSSKWLSTCYPQGQCDTEESQLCSAEYHTKNLLSPVLFEEVLDILPRNSLTLEVAPHALLKSFLKRSIKDGIHLSLTQRDNKDGVLFLMDGLGKLFQNGVDMDISQLYPPVSYPVSRGTPMISPLIKWDHSENYVIPSFDSFNTYEKRKVILNINDKAYEFVQGNIVDGEVIFPASGFLNLVWEMFSMMNGIPQTNVKVMFEDVKFLKVMKLKENQDVVVLISIHRSSGRFEVSENMTALVQGSIVSAEKVAMSDITVTESSDAVLLKEDDFYKEMRFRGYQHRGVFKAVHEIRDDGLAGKIKWNDNWVPFIDNLIQFQVLMNDTRSIVMPKAIRKMVIDPKMKQIIVGQSNPKLLDVVVCPYLQIISAGCLEIHGFQGNLVNKSGTRCFKNLQIKENVEAKPQTGHCYADCLVKGDMSSISWINGPLTGDKLKNGTVRIQFASLNQRDVMLANGKMDMNDDLNRVQKQASIGLEFSGVTNDGRRVMGIGSAGMALSTHYDASKALLWEIPETWTLDQAATVPLVYFTVYRAFFSVSKISKGKTILIHAGAGGLGQAAIQVALSYGLKVFTTVGSEDKKNFLIKKFPQLVASCIGNSRDASFGKMIGEGTEGTGVDFVLNSLSDDKLQLSVRCLTKNGTFLEIGRHDIMNSAKFNFGHFRKRINFKVAFFDDLLIDSQETKVIHKMLNDDIKAEIVQPLESRIFEAKNVEAAFRFMVTGKHTGKVLLKLHETSVDNESLPISVLPKIFCDSEETFVIFGEIDDFCLELADWLVLRGCKKLVLSHFKAFKAVLNKYQAYRIKIWKSYGVEVVTSTIDNSSKAGCEELIRNSISLGPIGGIFSLENPTEAVKYLDEISERLCKKLKYFVNLSVGAFGNDKTSLSELKVQQIMQQRFRKNLPAKFVQFKVRDFSLITDLQDEKQLTDGEILPQKINSCLDVLDMMLCVDDTLVQCMI